MDKLRKIMEQSMLKNKYTFSTARRFKNRYYKNIIIL